MKSIRTTIGLAVILNFNAFSQDVDLSLEEIMNRNVVDMSIQDWVDLDNQKINSLSFYGFLNLNAEKVFNEPSIDASGNTVYESGPLEMSTPSFHLYGGSKLSEKFTVFFNLGRSGDQLGVINAWGNWKIDDLFQIRVGRQYRRFGLFNERLDQIPTYLGIEPPELFDKDHLLLPRTSLVSVHGEKQIKQNSYLKYFFTTANGESGAEKGVLPFGWDFRYSSSFFLIGVSGYTSNLGSEGSSSTVELGSGSPRGGILPWMSSDKYNVYGIFSEIRRGNFGIKAAYFVANHNAVRDPSSVLMLANNGELNSSQTERMILPGADLSALTEDDVNTNGDYTTTTWYLRLSYDVNTTKGRVIPYLFFDSYKNRETIGSKSFGGDNESGVADNGRFLKPSLGLVYKPVEKVAIKLDASSHRFEFNGEDDSYPEVRLDISYMFK